MPATLDPPVRIMTDALKLGECEGVRFKIRDLGIERDAFAVRHRGVPRGYVNMCRHQALPLDFGDSVFFDDSCDALVCVHHGARYDPASGVCVSGPCEGARLTRLALEERDGALWCVGRLETCDGP